MGFTDLIKSCFSKRTKPTSAPDNSASDINPAPLSTQRDVIEPPAEAQGHPKDAEIRPVQPTPEAPRIETQPQSDSSPSKPSTPQPTRNTIYLESSANRNRSRPSVSSAGGYGDADGRQSSVSSLSVSIDLGAGGLGGGGGHSSFGGD